MEKVIAVVVTFNRQPLLQQCIAALRNQTQKLDKILVINNSSTDNTEEWLSRQADVEFITQPNEGSAGGFNTGISMAYKAGYSWIWLMDDDGFPKEDALEKILKDDTEQLCLRNCAVINKDDKKSFVWKTKNFKTLDEVKETVIKNVAHPFNGTMLHRKIVERVGLPKQSLFIFGDETEYYFRITRKNKIPYYTVSDSIHYHPASALSYQKDWNYKSTWKMYYYVRNRYHILKTKHSSSPLVALLAYLGFLVGFVGVILVFQKTDKFKKIQFMAWPATDAVISNFTATPALISHRLNKKPFYIINFSDYTRYFKNLFAWNTDRSYRMLKR